MKKKQKFKGVGLVVRHVSCGLELLSSSLANHFKEENNENIFLSRF